MPDTKPPLSVSFHNFWPGFVAHGSFFHRALGQAYEVTIARVGRDVQISSVFGTDPLPSVSGSRPLRVWWTGEARDPHGQIFDLHFGFRPTTILGARWFRFPLWITYLDWWDQASPYHVGRMLAPRTPQPRPRFCNFIYASLPSVRTEFFLRLNKARPVDSLGKALNNGGYRILGRDGKMRVLEESTFTIAFENQIASGYVTEKLLEPLLAGSIPIYWGAAEAKTDFNPEAFIFADDFANFDELVAHVLKVSDSAEAIAALASAPPFRDNRIPYEQRPEFFVDRIAEALSGDQASRSSSRWPDAWPSGTGGAAKRIERRFRQWFRRERE